MPIARRHIKLDVGNTGGHFASSVLNVPLDQAVWAVNENRPDLRCAVDKLRTFLDSGDRVYVWAYCNASRGLPCAILQVHSIVDDLAAQDPWAPGQNIVPRVEA